MPDWRSSTWGEEITLEYGKAIRGYQTADGPVPVYGTNGPVGWTDEPLYPAEGVILGRKGAYRGVHFSSTPFHVIDTAYYVVPKSDLDMRWLYYAIKYHRLGEIDDGSPIPSTTRAAVYVREFDVPNKAEQIEIAGVLSAFDDKIGLNRRMNETLEAQARALFRDWFVDFGPVKAKMAGAGPYLAPELWSLFPDRLSDDGVPAGWNVGSLSDLFVLQRGFDLPKTKRTDGPFPVIAASGPSGTHTEARVNGPGVCTGRSGVLGGVYYIEGDFWPLNTSLWIKAYPNSTALHATFTLQEIDIEAFNAGSAVPTLNRNHIHEAPAVVPPMNVIHAFDDMVSSFYAKKSANERESQTLSQTRDLLLPK